MVRHRRPATFRSGPDVNPARQDITPSCFEVLPPAHCLSGLVRGYWFIRDLDGLYFGRPVRTAPHPGGALAINIAKPNLMDGILPVPRLSLAGIQTASRVWHPSDETYFAMAMLTLPGLATLFPGAGAAAANGLIDLAGDVGQRDADSLTRGAEAGWHPAVIKSILDRWLADRLSAVRHTNAGYRAIRAYPRLKTRSVDEAAGEIGISRRQLNRWFRESFGLGPKEVRDLDRLSSSLSAAQMGGDAAEGYYDQSHRIRDWRRRTGMTPSRYRKEGPSEIATRFAVEAGPGAPFYL